MSPTTTQVRIPAGTLGVTHVAATPEDQATLLDASVGRKTSVSLYLKINEKTFIAMGWGWRTDRARAPNPSAGLRAPSAFPQHLFSHPGPRIFYVRLHRSGKRGGGK